MISISLEFFMSDISSEDIVLQGHLQMQILFGNVLVLWIWWPNKYISKRLQIPSALLCKIGNSPLADGMSTLLVLIDL